MWTWYCVDSTERAIPAHLNPLSLLLYGHYVMSTPVTGKKGIWFFKRNHLILTLLVEKF
jgi:hypothetical protein